MTKVNDIFRNVFALIGWGLFVVAIYLYAQQKGSLSTVDKFHLACYKEVKIIFTGDKTTYICKKYEERI